jgi:hypothetical protein
VEFFVNDKRIERRSLTFGERAPIEIRLGRKRKPSAVGYLFRHSYPLPDAKRGVGISTLGKVIRSGWDWLGVSPADSDRIGGLIEVPPLAVCLTLSKADFIHGGPNRALYLGYRKAVQEAVSRQLAAWGDARDAETESRRRISKPLERDLERVLMDLTDEFPLLSALVEKRAGAQRRLPIGRPGEPEDARALLLASVTAGAAAAEEEPAARAEPRTSVDESTPPQPGENGEPPTPPLPEPPPGPPDSHPLNLPGAPGHKRPSRLGLTIQRESRPEDPELAHLVESTVFVNAGHPAYRRAEASRSEGYHIALSVALALAPLAVDPGQVHAFVTAFLTRWGEALEGKPKKGRAAVGGSL